jgi:hypothetical protein
LEEQRKGHRLSGILADKYFRRRRLDKERLAQLLFRGNNFVAQVLELGEAFYKRENNSTVCLLGRAYRKIRDASLQF